MLLPSNNQIKQFDKNKSYETWKNDLNIHFCKNEIPIIPNETVEIVKVHFFYYKSMETLSCHSNQISYPTGIKNITFVEGNVLCNHAKFQLHPP